jgi:hypothetical protein
MDRDEIKIHLNRVRLNLDNFLIKPFSIQDLLRQIKICLDVI